MSGLGVECCQRQLDGHLQAARPARTQGQAAVMSTGDGIGQRQAQPDGPGAGACIVQARKGSQRFIAPLGRNAGTMVRNGNDGIVLLRCQRYFHRRFGVIQRIRNQVVQQPSERMPVGVKRQGGRPQPGKMHVAAGAFPGRGLFFQPVIELQRRKVVGARVGAAHETDKLVDHALHILDVFADAVFE